MTTARAADGLGPALRERGAIGTFLKLPRAEVVDLLAMSEVDFIVCDMEHGQITEAECRVVLRAAQGHGLPVVVRVPTGDRGLINRLLEAGAAGIQVPRMQDAGDVVRAVDLCRYPPEGTRSISLTQPAAGYGTHALETYVQRANAQTVVVGQFETLALAGDVGDVLDRLNVLFIGPVDLALDFSAHRPDDVDGPALRTQELERLAAEQQVVLGTYAGMPADIASLAARGYRYIVVGSDLAIIASAAAAFGREIASARSTWNEVRT
jgi:2-keto-3-deoxy-L-rhamnonate aldolase RhmA